MSDLSTLHVVWLLLATCAAGYVRGVLGFGSAMGLLPVLVAFTTFRTAVPVMTLTDWLASLLLLPEVRNSFDRKRVAQLTLGCALGIPVGVILLIDPRYSGVLRIIAVVIILAGVIAAISSDKPRVVAGTAGNIVTGVASGFLGACTSISGGVVAAVQLAAPQREAAAIRADLIVFFCVADALVLIALAYQTLLTRDVLLLSLALIPPFGIGILLGKASFRMLPEPLFKGAALAYLSLNAVLMAIIKL